MSIKIKTLLVAAGCAVCLPSCKKYLDVNKDPNVTQNVTVAVLLPTGQAYIASAIGVDLQINGGIWAQYWTQNPNSSQYRNIEQYQATSASYEYPWTNLYQGAENLFQMYQIAGTQHKKQYQAISLILQAYTFQVITDGWGDVPFSEALKGQSKDGGITSPHYDLQRAVYNGILGYLDSANALINTQDAVLPGADDLIYQGDMTKWQKFSNTLRLKVLLRLSQVDPATAAAGITALYAKSPAFIGSGDDAMINYLTTAGNNNPLYSEEVGLSGTQNLAGSKTAIDSMNGVNDYRAFAFYEYVTSTGVPVGLIQGAAIDPTLVIKPGSFSIPTPYVAGDATNSKSATAPVKFMTSYESYFLQAEAVARGWGTGSDSALYQQGIRASFFAYSGAFDDQAYTLADYPQTSANGDTITGPINLSADYGYYAYVFGDTLFGVPPAYWASYPSGGSVTQKLRFIITQKWFSMCGNQNFEAWAEWRRTGYPDFLLPTKNNLTGNVFPRRFLYPNSEITRNLHFPGLKSVTTKVYWDVR